MFSTEQREISVFLETDGIFILRSLFVLFRNRIGLLTVQCSPETHLLCKDNMFYVYI